MSMLSAQCDRLRKMAELVEGHGKVGFGDLIITDPLMVDAAKEMRDAADTIWQLRNDCVELRGQMDNAKHDLSVFSGRIAALAGENRKLRDENEKLRELCENLNRAAHMLCEAWEGSCSKEAEGMSLHAVCPISDTNELCVFGKLYGQVRELGVVCE